MRCGETMADGRTPTWRPGMATRARAMGLADRNAGAPSLFGLRVSDFGLLSEVPPKA